MLQNFRINRRAIIARQKMLRTSHPEGAGTATRPVVSEHRQQGKSTNSGPPAPCAYLRITRTSPARRLAERLELFFRRLVTVVLYDWAMLLRVSPFLTR